MSRPLSMQIAWWRWWSNPLVGLHPENMANLPFLPKADKPIDYFQLLHTRSIFELSDIPDNNLEAKPEFMSIALADPSVLERYLIKLSAFTMGHNIINVRPPEWESHYGIATPELIRQMIEHYRSIPPRLSKWQAQIAYTITQTTHGSFPVRDRMMLAIGVLLKSFYPAFSKRWIITQSTQTARLLETLDPLEEGLAADAMDWMNNELAKLHEHISADFEEADIELDPPPGMDEFPMLDVDAILGASNA